MVTDIVSLESGLGGHILRLALNLFLVDCLVIALLNITICLPTFH
jgi:hypothetical protein